jgi:hypothetical protein
MKGMNSPLSTPQINRHMHTIFCTSLKGPELYPQTPKPEVEIIKGATLHNEDALSSVPEQNTMTPPPIPTKRER